MTVWTKSSNQTKTFNLSITMSKCMHALNKMLHHPTALPHGLEDLTITIFVFLHLSPLLYNTKVCGEHVFIDTLLGLKQNVPMF